MKNKFAMEIFNLEGKISKKHANEIEELLEALLSKANRAGAEKMLKFIAKDQGWKYTKKEYLDILDKVLGLK